MKTKSVASLKQVTIGFAWPEWRWYLVGIIFLAITNIITLQIPQLAKQVVNAIENPAGQNLVALAQWMVALGILQIIIRTLSRLCVFWPGRKLEANTKSHLFHRMMGLPQPFFERFGMGDLISRIANDITHVRVFYGFALLQVLNLVFLAAFTIVMMASTHPTLTFAALTPLALMIVVIRYAMPIMQKYSLINQEKLGQLTNKATEAFVNVHVIQSNAAAQSFEERIAVENDNVYRSNMQLLVVRQVVFPLMTLFFGGSQAIVLLIGGWAIIKGTITVGDILAFNVYIGYLTFPLSAMGIVLAIYQRAKTAVSRLADIDTQAPEDDPATTRKQLQAPYELTVTNLQFRFDTAIPALDQDGSEDSEADPSKQPFQLEPISFTLKPGEKLGIYGAIGSGKSTILNLITRIHNPARAQVFINGVDILDMPVAELRDIVGYATQSVHLFSDSIEANLAFGLKDDVSKDHFDEAARQAEVLSEIEGFSEGWSTQIGEKGVRLSGGQKQRLALARIFVRKYPIVLLDDVLSAVDHTTEQHLIQNIHNSGASLIISSHRTSVLETCDRILILDDGKCIAQGSPQEVRTYMQTKPSVTEAADE